jgi:hypothetical protein
MTRMDTDDTEKQRQSFAHGTPWVTPHLGYKVFQLSLIIMRSFPPAVTLLNNKQDAC